MSKALIITVDGPAGAGKSTVSKALAIRMGYRYLDSGAMYRAFAYVVWKAEKNGKSLGVKSLVKDFQVRCALMDGEMRIFVQSEDITREIRTPPISMLASKLSTLKEVRDRLTELQRALGQGGGLVAEGRDMGTVVFPQAQVKFFLDASLQERARRRYQDLIRLEQALAFEAVLEEMAQRDRRDASRDLAPLKPAPDAIRIDSTDLSPEEVVQAMYREVQRRMS
jgi:cytidylate kinase